MLQSELEDLIRKVQHNCCETQTLEVKAAFQGAPKIYDTLSSFSNQSEGGLIIFGLDESANFEIVGVYDPQDLQKRIGEMGLEMEPIVRPATTVHTFEDGKSVVAAEIPPLDLSERPCFKRAAGRLRGSYVRVGDSDQRMIEYEVYAFEAYRKRIRVDQRQISIVGPDVLDPSLVQTFVERRTRNRPNISASGSAQMMELLGITRNGAPTLMSLLMFGRFPQVPFPELSIEASRVPGTEIGEVDADGSRFVSSRRIEAHCRKCSTALWTSSPQTCAWRSG